MQRAVNEQHEVTVLLADDEAIVRQAIGALFATDERFRVVASVASGFDAEALVRTLRPDVAVLDVRMPGGGATTLRSIRAQSPDTVVVVCSSHDDGHTRRLLADAGAAAYVVKGRDDVLDAVCQLLGMASSD